MRESDLQAQLRQDAPAWRDALAANYAPRAHRVGSGATRDRFRFPTALALGAAAMLAMAAFVALQMPEPGNAPTPTPQPRAAGIGSPMTQLLDPELLDAWRRIPAPPLQLTDAEALVTEPLRAETTRLGAEVASVVWFVVGLVPPVTDADASS